jgi:hypothetical protein
MVWVGFIWLTIGIYGELSEHGNYLSGYMKHGHFIDWELSVSQEGLCPMVLGKGT